MNRYKISLYSFRLVCCTVRYSKTDKSRANDNVDEISSATAWSDLHCLFAVILMGHFRSAEYLRENRLFSGGAGHLIILLLLLLLLISSIIIFNPVELSLTGSEARRFLCGACGLKMAADGGALKDINEIKSQFRTREGFYKLLTLSDSQQRAGLPRGPSAGVTVGPGAGGGAGVGLVQGPGSAAAAAANSSPGFLPPVRVSMVKLKPEDPSEDSERVCFNIGRELYFYTYTNIKKAVDLSKPIDKRIYKGTQPTCHDFNQYSATADSVALIVGFSAGQVQYLDPIKKETSKLFNEESENLFLASHASGHLYLYNVEHPCGTTAPQYCLLRQGEGFAVYACKTKTPRNPLLRWVVGEGGLNEFAFSPDGVHVACVGQDGCLRVFHFDSMELQGVMKSYFGGLLCVSWSPDGKYLATGGEDDLVTVWSFAESRVVARGHGHKSWVNVVAFDPFTTNLEDEEPMELSGSEEDLQQGALHFGRVRTSSTLSRLSRHSSKGGASSVSYRFGSVGQDTQFCLWDLTDDVLYPRLPLSRALTNTFGPTIPSSTALSGSGGVEGHHHPSNPHQTSTLPLPLPRSLSRSNSLPHPAVANTSKSQGATESGGTGGSGGGGGSAPFSIGRFATLSLQERKSDKSGVGGEKEHKRYHSLGNISKSNDKINVAPRSNRLDGAKVLGTTLCPRMNEVPLLEPLVCKKIAHERLTVLVFMNDCIITATRLSRCQHRTETLRAGRWYSRSLIPRADSSVCIGSQSVTALPLTRPLISHQTTRLSCTRT
ncbi:WD repeat-containing protein 20 [Labeo rohita]|uniref:WD repeat-containing protein 20 n=2 Tax=Labeonini TaxID=2743697 RepID=A0ABQ8M1X7_LABRO|nr:WD repeat-containing protein 20 [Labeo rohita]